MNSLILDRLDEILGHSIARVPEAWAREAATLGTVACFRCEIGGQVEEVALDFRAPGAEEPDEPSIVITLREPALEQLARDGKLNVDESWRNGWLSVAGSALDWRILYELICGDPMPRPPAMGEVLASRARGYALIEEHLTAGHHDRLVESFRSWCHQRPIPLIDHFVSDFGPVNDTPRPWLEPEELALTAASIPLWSDIRDEAWKLASGEQRVPAFHAEHDAASDFTAAPLQWGAHTFFKGGKLLPNRLDGLPATAELLRRVPADRLVTLAFLVLGPRSTIEVHSDNMPFFSRWHLGLVVPPGCTLEVAQAPRALEEGQCLSFCDAFLHRATNPSTSNRLVLSGWCLHPDLTDAECAALRRIIEQWGIDALTRSV